MTLISVSRSKPDIFYFFGEKSPAGVVKVPAAILNPVQSSEGLPGTWGNKGT